MIFNERRIRTQQGPLLAGYPAQVRRLMFWFDQLTDWQRVQYALGLILFLLACAGYLLGLGSTIMLQRVQQEDEALAAAPLATAEPTEIVEPTPPPAAVAPPTSTPVPSPTARPTVRPSPTPFSAPVIAEPPAAPRDLPAAPLSVAPVVAPATATAAKPRNLETSKPEPPAASVATPTPGRVGAFATAVSPTAVRQTAPASGSSGSRGAAATPLPTLALPATRAPTPAPARATTAPTTAKTPAAR